MSGTISIRVLNDLYIAVSEGDETAIVTARARLEDIRTQILEQKSDLYRSIFDRYFRLISLHVPGLDQQIGLNEAERANADRFVREQLYQARSVAALDVARLNETVDPALRIAVSGIGRSGTTLIYQQLAKLLLLDDRKTNFRYEPYLWNIRSAETKGNPFDMTQLHQFGLMVHKTVPLFLDEPNPVHDPFIDHLFNERWDRDRSLLPDAYLTKVIRGSGRLRSYLSRYPDLKIVACLRNPVDTINSSLGMFSFFGEEFHADDRPRFRAELQKRGANVDALGEAARSIEWYSAWWRAFTEDTLATAAAFPDRVFLFTYEAFQEDSQAMLDGLMDFVGVRNLGMQMGLNAPAGPTIKATSLTQHDMHKLAPEIDYYKETVLVPRLGRESATARVDKVVSRYLGGRFSFPIAGSDVGRRAPIQLRGMMLNNGTSPFLQLAKRHKPVLPLPDLIATHYEGDAADLCQPVVDGQALKRGKTFGVVIACHNNSATIADAVLSCLNQSLPFDEIIVVNDKSTDTSALLLNELANLYSSVKVLDLPSNLGPSAARDLAIRRLSTDFFTQLDGDDLFWPTKNATEAAAIAGDEGVVAFSDVLLVRPEGSNVQSTGAYGGKTGLEVLEILRARTPQIPRDMTLSRKLYFDAGGYNMMMRLYEDWEFKMRLAAKSRSWQRAEGIAGTVYNRITPGLSGVDDSLHARALAQIFLRALAFGEGPSTEVLAAYDAAIGRFRTHHVAKKVRAVVEEALARPSLGLKNLAAFAGRRDVSTLGNSEFGEALASPIAEHQKCEAAQ